jgi:CSLREA domain-containing protein
VQEEEAQEARGGGQEEEVQEEEEKDVTRAGLYSLAAALLASLALPAGAAATTIDVTSTADNKTDDQLCTLREAVDAANTNAAVNPAGGSDCPAGSLASTDTIALGLATYAIGGAAGDQNNVSGDLDVSGPSGPLVIEGRGPGSTTIDANDSDRVLDTLNAGNLTLRDLTATDGTIVNGPGGGIHAPDADLTLIDAVVSANTINGTDASGMRGAGVDAERSLTMTSSTVGPNNVIISSGAGAATIRGGGIFVGTSAPATIDRSTIRNNGILGAASQTLVGGGLATSTAEENLTVTNSTIADNGLSGGGTQQGGGILWDEVGNDDTLRVTNSTFSGNSVGSFQNGGGIYIHGGTGNTIAFSTFGPTTPADMNGAGIYKDTGPVAVRGSVFETNTDDDCGGGLPGSLGFNVEKSGNDCFFTQPTDVLTTLQILDSAGLTDNGGPTKTIELFAGSPAKETVPAASCLGADGAALTQDQRGAPRPDDGDSDSTPECEAGAYERVACGSIQAKVIGTPGADTLTGTVGPDAILGLGGNDTILPGAGADQVCAGPGNDTLAGGDDDGAADFYRGDDGSDTYDITDFLGAATVNLATGQVDSGGSLGSEVLDSIENVTGGQGPDTLIGDNGPNRLDGSFGDDPVIAGAGGSDQLLGGSGNDGLFARDGLGDSVDCGPGMADSAQTDRLSLDAVSGCESVDALPEEPSVVVPPPAGGSPALQAPGKAKCKKKKKRKTHAAAAKKKRCKKKRRT